MIEKYGWSGAILIFLAPYARMAWKKWFTGEWTSYGELKKGNEAAHDKIKLIGDRIDGLLLILNRMENEIRRIDKIQAEREIKESSEEVLMERLIGRLEKHDQRFDFVRERIEALDQSQKESFRIMGEIKNFLLEHGK